MRFVTAFTAAVALAALLAPGVVAEESCASGPPCGRINPYLDLILPGKLACGSSYVLGQDLQPEECLTPPQEGEPLVMSGQFRLYWEICEEATYLNDPNDPIVVSFSGTDLNPSFMDFSIEPDTFSLDTATLFSPEHITPTEDGQNVSCWYDYKQDITVSLERTGNPTSSDAERIVNQNCIAVFNIKMESDESGAQFQPGWAIEPFRFHMLNDPAGAGICEGKTTPGVGTPVLVGTIGLAALLGRRR